MKHRVYGEGFLLNAAKANIANFLKPRSVFVHGGVKGNDQVSSVGHLDPCASFEA